MRLLVALLTAVAAFSQGGNPEQLFREAVAAQQQGDDATAIRKYQELLKIRPDVLEVRANLGAALSRAGRFDEAIEQYRAALSKDPASVPLRVNLALAYYKKSSFREAANELESLRAKSPGDLRIVTLLADCYSRLGQEDRTITLLTPAASAHSEDLGVAWLLGSALIHKGRNREGLELVERVGKQGNSAEAYLLAGQTALKMNEFERARNDADAALRLNPKLPGALTLRGEVLPYLGDNQGAIDALISALQANPNDFDAHLNLGAVLLTERRLEEARQHLERAVALQPDSTMARYETARLERAEGKLDAAIRDFENVVQGDPGWAQPHLELSALYYRVNRQSDGDRERALYDRLSSTAAGR